MRHNGGPGRTPGPQEATLTDAARSPQDGGIPVADPLAALNQARDRLAIQFCILSLIAGVPLVAAVHYPAPHWPALLVGVLTLGLFGLCIPLVRAGFGPPVRVLILAGLLASATGRGYLVGGADRIHFACVIFVPLLGASLVSVRAGWAFAAASVASVLMLGSPPAGTVLATTATEQQPWVMDALKVALLVLAAFVGSTITRASRMALSRSVLVEDQLRRTEERYALAATGANYGAWDWDVANDALWLAPGVLEIIGEEPVGQTVPASWWRDRIHPADVHHTARAMQNHQAAGDRGFAVQYRVRHANGTWMWVESRGCGVPQGTPWANRIVGSFTDVGELRTMREALEHRALHDGLTGLPNRALFTRVLHERLQADDAAAWAVLVVDLDRFKAINDSFGQTAGDRVLAVVADRLRAAVPSTATVARLGGDEFAVLLESVAGLVESEALAAQLVEGMDQPVLLDGSEVIARVSIGLVVSDGSYREPEDVLRDVDFALTTAKSEADVRSSVFHPSMRQELRPTLELDLRLRRALEQRHFVPWFQRIVDLETRRTVGWESLVRWEQPNGDVLLPGAFLPRAEEIGLLPDIDRMLVEEACSEVADWSVVGPPQLLSVNLSPRQFARADTVDWVAAMLRKTGLPASRLQLEVTERTLLTDRGDVRETMEALRALGVMIALDDFGTGYSSLGYLETFPLDVLKIDRRFVQGGRGGRPGPICDAIVSMASSLGLVVVAEGVETEDQRKALLDLGCTRGQGWLFGRPEPTRVSGVAAG